MDCDSPYDKLLRITAPVEGRPYPTFEYRQTMIAEGVSTRIDSVGLVPGLLRPLGRVAQALSRLPDQEHRKTYLRFMALRQAVATQTKVEQDAVIRESDIRQIATLGGFAIEQLDRLEASLEESHIQLSLAPDELVADYTGENVSGHLVFYGQHPGAYTEFHFVDPTIHHAAWYNPDTPDYERLVQIQAGIRQELGPYDPQPMRSLLEEVRFTLTD